MKPYYESEGITIYHGDCREILPTLRPVHLVLTDPPWGTDTACNARRFTRKSSPWWSNVDTQQIQAHEQIIGDKEEFDPRPFIGQKAILWGANNFTRHLPHSGGWIIWDKRKGAEAMAEKGWPLGEAELAWTNIMGATRVFRNLWSGLLRSEEKGLHFHPTQKPLNLMRFCLALMPNPDQVVLDPFMGSGTTLLAAKGYGYEAIGIEIEEKYCEIAANRLRQSVMQFGK
jgi:site-specific DNA-methyltransferase (adenine-specific)